MDCPQCNGTLRRSKTRTFAERVIKQATGYRTWRCRQCHWRGLKTGKRFMNPVVATRIVRLCIAAMMVLMLSLAYYASGWVRQYRNQQRFTRPMIQRPISPRQTGQLQDPVRSVCET